MADPKFTDRAGGRWTIRQPTFADIDLALGEAGYVQQTNCDGETALIVIDRDIALQLSDKLAAWAAHAHLEEK